MAIGVNQYQILSPEQANPLGYGIAQAIQAMAQRQQGRLAGANAAAQEAKNPFVGQREAAALAHDLDVNKWYGKDKASEIGLRGAQAGYYGEETNTAKYKREHGLLEPAEIQQMKYALELARKQREANQFTQQNQVPETSLSNGGLNVTQSQLRPGIENVLKQSQQPNVNQIPEIPRQQPQQQTLPGTDIPSLGDPLADRLYMKMLGIKEPTPLDPAKQKHLEALTKRLEQNQKAEAFKSLPAPDKHYEIAQARSLGLSGSKASRELLDGKTVEDIAEEKGYDRNKPETWPLPSPPPTTAVVTQQQRANIARAGVAAAEPLISQALAPYAGKVKNYSPKEMWEATQGLSKDARAEAMAASFMAKDLVILQARATGVQNIGVTLMRDLLKSSKNELNTMDITMDPETYQKMQDHIVKIGNIINRAERNEEWNMYRNESPSANDFSSTNSSNSNLADINAQIADLERQLGSGE